MGQVWGHHAGLDCPAPQHHTLIICQERGYKEEATVFSTVLWEWWEGRLDGEVVGKPGEPAWDICAAS